MRACRGQHGLGAALLLVLALLAPAATQAQRASPALPALGDGGDMALGAERKLGERIARELYRDPDFLDDPVLSDYVQSLWRPLLAAARQRGELTPELEQRFAWEILLGRDRTVNAFALPGGYLGLHLGLLGVVSSRDELASVLAHELSHVTQRHISRLMTQQERQTPWMLGAMILGMLAASKNPQASQAVLIGSQAVVAQTQLNFSRDMEREADRIGYSVMTEAGFSGQGFVGMFEKLEQAARLNDSGAFPYLRSHPLTTERMADMRSRAPLEGAKAPFGPLDLEHAMVSARARVLSQPGVDVLRAWAGHSGLPEPANGVPTASTAPTLTQAATLYAAAAASAQLRDGPRARELAARLQTLVGADPRAARQARLLVAEIALLLGDLSAARQALPPITPASARPELFLHSQWLTRNGEAARAAAQLQVWVLDHPRDAAAWELLAVARDAQGQRLRAIHAQAEAQVARLDYAAAVDRLRAAQNWSQSHGIKGADHIEASIIDTRLRELESLRREQALER